MNRQMIPTTFTADYVGEPGQRTFYLQARTADAVQTYLVEKQQVALLAEKLGEILVNVDRHDTIRATQANRDPALALTQPVEPEWRVGAIGLGYEEEEDVVVVMLQPAEGDEDEASVADESVRFVLRRDQVRAFVLHAIAVIDEGRPLCMLCGLPIDPTGHLCPASNGHRLGA